MMNKQLIIKSLESLEKGNKNTGEFRREIGLLGNEKDEEYTNLMNILRESEFIKCIGKKEFTYAILPKGLQLLINNRLNNLEESQTKFSKYLLLATFILALGVVMDQIDKLVNAQLFWNQKAYAFSSAMLGFIIFIIMIFIIGNLTALIFKEVVFRKG